MRWPILAMVVALVVIVGGVAIALNGGGDDEQQPARTPETNRVVPPPAQETTAEEPIARGDVTVAVLNGTTVTGLAKRTAERIEDAGFDVLDELVTDAVEQNRSATVVMYAEGARDEAREVAKAIEVGGDAVVQLDSSTRTVTQNRARVVVTVGADQSQQ
jgi:hypothetical protein